MSTVIIASSVTTGAIQGDGRILYGEDKKKIGFPLFEPIYSCPEAIEIPMDASVRQVIHGVNHGGNA